MACGIVSLLTVGRTTDMDSRADIAKARRMVETAGDLQGRNLLFATSMMEDAEKLAPEDTTVVLAANNVYIMLNPDRNELYYRQLDMLEKTPSPAKLYYYTLTRAIAPDADTDSLAAFKMAMRAYRRFPDTDMFIENVLKTGQIYLLTKKYRFDREGNPVDTMDLTAEQADFGRNLLALADTIETARGYSPIIDNVRASVNFMLDDREGIAALTRNLEERDSTDIDALDLLISLAYMRGDTTQVNDLGIRRFEIEPDPEHLYSLYTVLPEGEMRKALIDRVLKKSADTDVEPELRLNLLKALGSAYGVGQENDSAGVYGRIDEVLTEVTAEDPGDLEVYMFATFLRYTPDWVTNYGYRHWMDALNNVPDSVEALFDAASALVPMAPADDEFDEALQTLTRQIETKLPGMEALGHLLSAQHYINTEKFDKALAEMSPLTLDDIRSIEEGKARYGWQNNDEKPADADEMMKKWLQVQTLISECQMKLGKVDEALATLNHIIAVDPENAGALNNLAYYMCENGRDLTIAESLVNRSLALVPDNVNSLDTRAWIYFKLGKLEPAMADMRKLFAVIDVDLDADILSEPSDKTLEQVLQDKNLNIVMLVPELKHLVEMLRASDGDYEAAIERISEVITKYDEDNEE